MTALNSTVKSTPFWKREDIWLLAMGDWLLAIGDGLLAIGDGLLAIGDEVWVVAPTWMPTSGVMPISAPIAKTMTVKKIALAKLTAAKSTVA